MVNRAGTPQCSDPRADGFVRLLRAECACLHAGFRITSVGSSPDQIAVVMSLAPGYAAEAPQETLRTSNFPANHIKVSLAARLDRSWSAISCVIFPWQEGLIIEQSSPQYLLHANFSAVTHGVAAWLQCMLCNMLWRMIQK